MELRKEMNKMENMNDHVVLTLGALNNGILRPNDIVEFAVAPSTFLKDSYLVTRPTDVMIRMVDPATYLCRDGSMYEMLVCFNLSPITFYGGQTLDYDLDKFMLISAGIKSIERTSTDIVNEKGIIGSVRYVVSMHNIRSVEVFEDFDSLPGYILPSIGRVYSVTPCSKGDE